jgi:hypothetical protein
MALKDWEKVYGLKGIWQNKSATTTIEISDKHPVLGYSVQKISVRPFRRRMLTARRFPRQINAVKFAKSYMRKH